MKRPQLQGQEVQPNTCGLTAAENDQVAFWRSRTQPAGFDPFPFHLTDLDDLAQRCREAFVKVDG